MDTSKLLYGIVYLEHSRQGEVSYKERTIIEQRLYRQYRIGRIRPLLSAAWRKKINMQRSNAFTFFYVQPIQTLVKAVVSVLWLPAMV